MAAEPPLSPSVVHLDGPFRHDLLYTRGVRLHVAQAGDAADPLILLLHGSFGGWFDYKDVLALLADRGFHVVAADMRGYGMSDKPPTGFGYDIRSAVGDVTGLIRALGHTSATLVGTDTGGAVAWCAAAAAPRHVDALVCVSAAHPVDTRRATASRPWLHATALLRRALGRFPLRRLLHRDALFRWQLRRSTDASFHHSARYEEALRLRLTARRIGSTHAARRRNNRLLSTPVPAKWLGLKVAAPTLMLAPARSAWLDLIRRSTARLTPRAAARSRSSHIPGTKNLPSVENPEAFTAALADFLGEVREGAD
ncbi:alpha/beta hydrolase [Corynebacterium sp. zg-331]|uniref:alpha/beta fold hydrolase n=1 Tax=unclassified Corynebacterium TaxID=2624378 RepID=UPI00128D01D2|nr:MULTISPECIES: alpha/beta hydrolase [unclassified Corynebacterium]MBC3186566.1 alpha/beta hydrolase [Corynebacterium sp. zg-331]MPV53050.1 alpha/beta fold hydrolase [Corynebacterium sp. zg331]